MTSQTIALAAVALLATANPAHALVAAPAARLRRPALPSPTTLHYLDYPTHDVAEEGPAESVSEPRSLMNFQEALDRGEAKLLLGIGEPQWDNSGIGGAKKRSWPRSDVRELPGKAPRRRGSRLLALPSSVASLWLQAQTIGEEDRRLYFEFVRSQNLDR